MLEGRTVALGITGSVAAVKTVELAHELRRRGATVQAVMTPAAADIIHPWAVEFATGTEPITEITGAVEHVALCGRDGDADVLLLAPTTANTVGKIAAAIDDTPVTTAVTTALGADVPVVLAPAMHKPMYDHPGVLDALAQLREWGISIVEPRIAEGKAKLATIDAIATATARAATDDPLAGQHIVVTAGATATAIDPVRVLTNRSSGRMGRAIATACAVRGAKVTVVHGPVGTQPLADATASPRHDDPAMPYTTCHTVETTAEMIDAVEDTLPTADAVISAAAIGDYTTETAPEKLRSGTDRTLRLAPTPKLLDRVRNRRPELPLVAFKLEATTDEQAVIDAADTLRDRVDATFVVGNSTDTLGATATRVVLVDADGATTAQGSKADLAAGIVDELAARIT